MTRKQVREYGERNGENTRTCHAGHSTENATTETRNHESRSTSAGSIREARYAGSHAASTPMNASVAAAPARVAGSRGSRLYSSVATNLAAHALARSPALLDVVLGAIGDFVPPGALLDPRRLRA